MKPLRSNAPRGTLLHPDFAWVPAAATNVAATWERARERMAREAQQQDNVKPIKRKAK